MTNFLDWTVATLDDAKCAFRVRGVGYDSSFLVLLVLHLSDGSVLVACRGSVGKLLEGWAHRYLWGEWVYVVEGH